MPTNNPLPSSNLEDFKDNSIILDHFVNSQEEQHPDRFGRTRPTITGIIREVFNVRTDISNMNETLIGQSRWDAVPKNTSLALGGDNGALNKQAQALFNRTVMLKTHSREALRRTYLEVGLNLVEGSFEEGGTLNTITDILLEEKTGKVYSWSGSFPKIISENTLPGSNVLFIEKTQNSLLSILKGPDGGGQSDVFYGGGWTGLNAGVGHLQGSSHTNAIKIRYDIKQSLSLDPVVWFEKEMKTNRGDTTNGDTGWDGGAGYFCVKKTEGNAPVNVLTGYARHNGGSAGMIGVLGRGSGQVLESEVWGMWAYAEIGFGAKDTGITQCIALESNTCNRGPDLGWMSGTGLGAARGVLSITADGTNRCTHGFYTGNHKANGMSPGTGGWWTGYLVARNSIAANTNGTTTYVGDGEGFRVNGSGSSEHAYGGFRFYDGFLKYGTSYKEATFVNNTAILMGAGKRINWGDHVGSSRWIGYDSVTNSLSLNAMGLAIGGVRVLGEQVVGLTKLIGNMSGGPKDITTITIQELAEYVNFISDVLLKHGLAKN